MGEENYTAHIQHLLFHQLKVNDSENVKNGKFNIIQVTSSTLKKKNRIIITVPEALLPG